jgi:hypothetical protein
LAEVLEISVDVIGSQTFQGLSLSVEIVKEVLDVPHSVLARRKSQSPFLALVSEEISEPRIIAPGRRSLFVGQAAEPLQKAGCNRTEALSRPARSHGPTLSHPSRCPISRDGLKFCSFEAMFSGPSLDLLGNA